MQHLVQVEVHNKQDMIVFVHYKSGFVPYFSQEDANIPPEWITDHGARTNMPGLEGIGKICIQIHAVYQSSQFPPNSQSSQFQQKLPALQCCLLAWFLEPMSFTV